MDARRRMRAREYDAALDFQGLVKSAALTWISGARRRIGFERSALREPAAAAFYSERVAANDSSHVIEKNLSLAATVGADTSRLEFPLGPVESGSLNALRSQADGPFVLLNCGAAWPNKRWPPERFGRIAAWLHQTHHLRSVVLWGPGEQSIAEHVVRASSEAAVAAPPTSLRDLVAFARVARLMVSGDTGPTHVASAVGTPDIALFGPTSSQRNGPWNPADVSITRYAECDCHYERSCRRDVSRWCLASITEEQVRAAIERRLSV
jgi:ADP-heptose:LPS heptosyltransferase